MPDTDARELLARATEFTGAFAQPGNQWRAEARSLIVDLAAEIRRLRDALGEAWDDGNATGLDGWVGPGRGGSIPVDDQAIHNRHRCLHQLQAVPR